jgi:hypothetical protein
VSQYSFNYTLGGGRAPNPGPLARLKAALMLGVLVAIGAVIVVGFVAVGLILLPFALIAIGVGWFLIRRRIRQAVRAMETPPQDISGRENVRVRKPAQDNPF